MVVSGINISDRGTVVYDEDGILYEIEVPFLKAGDVIEKDIHGLWHIISDKEEDRQRDMFYYDTRHFLSFGDYCHIIDRYPHAHDMFVKDPFFLMDVTRNDKPVVSFPVIDKNICLDTFQKRMQEIRRCAIHFLIKNEEAGNTWMWYSDLKARILNQIKEDGHPFLYGYTDILAFLQTEMFYVSYNNKRMRVALFDTYRREHVISHVVDMVKDMHTTMPLWAPEDNPLLSEEQKYVVKNIIIKGGRISILTGGPGTGKTTILKDIVYNIQRQYPESKIFLLSTTGKAARVISSVFGGLDENISTVHKFLGFGHPRTQKDTLRIRSAEFVVVDEASMLDLETFSTLMSALDFSKCKLLLVGDVDQLPSIGAGNILSDLIERGVYTIRLKENHRSTESIVNNACRIRDGIPLLEEDENFRVIDLPKSLCSLLSVRDFTPDTVIITPYRKKGMAGSCTDMNEEMQKFLNEKPGFNPGDRVIMSRTSYRDNYYNGEPGVVVSKTVDGYYVDLYDRTVLVKEEDDMDLGYAMTVHKSQGSEYNMCNICIPEYSPFITRRMLYTAVTRAKEKVRLYTTPGILFRIINNNPDIDRHTFLRE